MPLSKALGWIALLYAACAALAGVPLAWHYVPSLEHAHASLFDLHAVVPFGGLLRSLHHWSGHLSLVFTSLHFALSLRAGHDLAPGRVPWATGLLALATLASIAFVGRLLPWDDHAAVSWVVTQSFFGCPAPAGMAAGTNTLMRMLVLHIVGGAALLGWMAAHLSWRAALREKGFLRETLPLVAAFALLSLALLVLSAPVPLGAPFHGFVPGTTASAEWYLRWLQFLAEKSTWLARGAIFALAGLAMLSIAARTPDQRRARRWVWAAVLLALVLASAMPIGRPEVP